MNREHARRMWQLVEPYHAIVYFAPEAREIYTEAGLKGGWMGYFASRAAAMGAAAPEVVIATFYNFHPNMVRRAIPDAWRFSTPEKVLDARSRVADLALRRLLGDIVDGERLREAGALARRATEAADPVGRALFAAHASLPWPESPHLALWHAATLLREFRGDGHVAALLAHGIDGCEAHVLLAAKGTVTAEKQREHRGWSAEEWFAAEERLRRRGLVDADAQMTDAGRKLHEDVERTTDDLSLAPYVALGEESCRTLESHMLEIDRRIVREKGLPFPNAMGLTLPSELEVKR